MEWKRLPLAGQQRYREGLWHVEPELGKPQRSAQEEGSPAQARSCSHPQERAREQATGMPQHQPSVGSGGGSVERVLGGPGDVVRGVAGGSLGTLSVTRRDYEE